MTVLLLSSNILAYLDCEVVSQIRVIYESSPQFPAVTLCDSNKLTTLNAYFLQHSFYSLVSQDWERTYRLASMVASNSSYGDENRKKLGLSRSMIESCSFNKNEDCLNDLYWYWDNTFGNCFQFMLLTIK